MSQANQQPDVQHPVSPTSREAGASGARGNVRIQCGVHCHRFPVAGLSVGEVRRLLSELLNIPSETATVLNGESVSDEVLLQEGDALVFVRHGGAMGLTA